MSRSTVGGRHTSVWHLLAVLAFGALASLLVRAFADAPKSPPVPGPTRDREPVFTYQMFQEILLDCGVSPDVRPAALTLSPDDYSRWQRGELTIYDSVEMGVGLHEDLNGDGALDRFLPLASESRAWILTAYKQKDGSWKSPEIFISLALNDLDGSLRNAQSLRVMFSEARFHQDMQDRRAKIRKIENASEDTQQNLATPSEIQAQASPVLSGREVFSKMAAETGGKSLYMPGNSTANSSAAMTEFFEDGVGGGSDTEPPTLDISVSPKTIWPADHRMVVIDVHVEVEDNVDPAPVVEILEIVSSEPDNIQRRGDASPDFEIRPDGKILVRAERRDTARGRTYTITYRATDDAGNMRLASAYVMVHEKGPEFQR